jgi:hypothetical protein
MTKQVSCLGNLRIAGALVMDQNNPGFPANPKIGTLLVKGSSLYAYCLLGTMETWYPLVSNLPANTTYVHTQATPSLQWTVNHGLDVSELWYQLQDANGDPLSELSKVTTDTNSFKLNFATAEAGRVIVVSTAAVFTDKVVATKVQIGSGVVLDATGLTVNGVLIGGVTLADVTAAINAVVAGAPAALDTLNEIAARIVAGETSEAAIISTINTEIARALAAEALLVAKTTTVNGKALSANVTLTAADIGTAGVPNDIAGMVLGKPNATQQVLRYVAARACSLPANLVGSIAKAAVASTGAQAYSLQKNGAQFSTMSFAAGGVTPTWGTCAATNFAVGDVLTVVAPAAVDATLADIGFTLLGSLT